MDEMSWAKADGTSAVVVEYKVIDGKERYTVAVMPCGSVLYPLRLEKRSQIALVIDVLLEVLADTEEA